MCILITSEHVYLFKETTAGDFYPFSAVVCTRKHTIWYQAGFFYWSEFSFCSPVPFICNCGITQANRRQFLIYIFGMLCYKSLSKSQVYIFFAWKCFLFSKRQKYDIKTWCLRGHLLLILSVRVSYRLLYIQ